MNHLRKLLLLTLATLFCVSSALADNQFTVQQTAELRKLMHEYLVNDQA